MDRDTTFGLLAFGMMMVPVVTVCFHALSEPDSLPRDPVQVSTWIAGGPLGAFIGVALTLITFKAAGWFRIGTTIPLMGFLAVPVISFVAAYGILRFCPYLKVYLSTNGFVLRKGCERSEISWSKVLLLTKIQDGWNWPTYELRYATDEGQKSVRFTTSPGTLAVYAPFIREAVGRELGL